ncbi:MAG: PHP domain-containing protein [Anaerolineae bacterium]|jgi:predicted metal-dependent phosphoesterase TrpH
MRIDLHVHTSRYSSCGHATPEEMAQAALDHGLDGIVLTEHNVTWPLDELAELRAAFPALTILSGIELTSDRGDDYLVLGLPRQDWFAPRLPAEEIVQRSQRLGGVVILAHPYRYRDDVPEILFTCPVDGIEVASCNMHGGASQGAVRLVQALGAFPVWNSDAHHTRDVGLYANVLPGRIADEVQLAAALAARTARPFADATRISATNAIWREYLPQIRQLIADGVDDPSIRAALSDRVGYSDLYAVRNDLEVLRPLPPWQPEPLSMPTHQGRG